MKKLSTTVIKTVLFFVSWVLLIGLIPTPNNSNSAVWRFWAELIPFLCILCLTLIFWLIEKRRVTLNIVSKPFRNSLMGIVTGVLWIGAVVAVLMLSGVIKVTNINTISMLWL